MNRRVMLASLALVPGAVVGAQAWGQTPFGLERCNLQPPSIRPLVTWEGLVRSWYRAEQIHGSFPRAGRVSPLTLEAIWEVVKTHPEEWPEYAFVRCPGDGSYYPIVLWRATVIRTWDKGLIDNGLITWISPNSPDSLSAWIGEQP